METEAASQEISASQLSTQKLLIQRALEANKRLQQTLTEKAHRIEAELIEADKLLTAASTDDGCDDTHVDIEIPGAKKAAGPFPPSELLNCNSPFYAEASLRSQYLSNVTAHPMKGKELDSLADAVKRENQRLQAYRAREGRATPVQIDLENNVEGLDWSLIAEKVSDASKVKYTADECRIRWLGDRHPRINHTDWTAPELKNLGNLVSAYLEKFSKVDWVDVATKLGTNRTPIDCMRRGLPRQRHVWTAETDRKLLNAVQLFGIDNWNLVARHVSEHATGVQCQTRYCKSLDPSIKRGIWTDTEDERLRKAVAAHGNAWMKIAEAMPGRTNDQCHERWTEKLNLSSTATSWTEEEDRVLLEAVKTMGNQWKAISVKIGNGKTGSNCRLRHDKLKKLAAKGKVPLQQPGAGSSIQHSLPEAEPSGSTANTTRTSGADTTTVTPKPRARVAGKGKGKAFAATSIPAVVPNDGDEASVASAGANEMPAIIPKNGRKRAAANSVDETVAPAKKKRKTEKLAKAEEEILIASRPEESGSSQVNITATKRPRPRPVKKRTGNESGLMGQSLNSTNINMLQQSPQEPPVLDDSTLLMVENAKSTNVDPTHAIIVTEPPEVGTKPKARPKGRLRKMASDVAAPLESAPSMKSNTRAANARPKPVIVLGSRRSSRLASQVMEVALSEPTDSLGLATTSEPIEAASTEEDPTTVETAYGDTALPQINLEDM